ncbi:unnamed protein product [Rotaria socialis]|uniref:Uncharacterized protein n=1 Tax=Rotaria socialis TaxID=392032 RepID=A0A818LWU5_9BILA|nr:unnamed protein product [Rotaria socialis]
MENTDIISDHAQVNRTIKEECQCDLAINYLLQMKILVLKTVEREDVPFIAKILGCKPITSLDHFQQDMVGSIDLVEEKLQLAQIKSLRLQVLLIQIIQYQCYYVVRRALCAGEAVSEIELSVHFSEYAQSLSGVDHYCIREFTEALEFTPCRLTANAD